MNKTSLLNLLKEARRRAEAGDLDISAQHQIIIELEKNGVPAEEAQAVLAHLIETQEIDLSEMERLLDVMDRT